MTDTISFESRVDRKIVNRTVKLAQSRAPASGFAFFRAGEPPRHHVGLGTDRMAENPKRENAGRMRISALIGELTA